MSKLIFSNTPYKTTIDELKKLYKGINLALFSDKERGFAKVLASEGFTVELFDAKNEKPLPEHIRVIICDGGLTTLNLAKIQKQDRELYIIGSSAYREYFSNTCISDNQTLICGTPNMIVIDNRLYDKASSIASLMTLLTDVCDILMSRAKCTQTLKEFREEAVEMLLIPKDSEAIIRLIHKGEELLTKSGFVGHSLAVSYINSKRISNVKRTVCDFFCSYVINYVLFRFTFFKNNGILLGADRVRIRPLLDKRSKPKEVDSGFFILRDKEKAYALTAEELRAMAFNFRLCIEEMAERPKISDIYDNILIAFESFNWEGLTNVLIGQGFIEGIRNGTTS